MQKTLGLAFVLSILLSSQDAMAIEEAKYDVISKEAAFEIRNYASHIVAEIIVNGELEDAGSDAFQSLFNYISGQNATQSDIAMTAPVAQQSVGENIAMTAPVGQQKVATGWAVSFMMPDSYTIETLPTPNDERVVLRQVASQTIAAIRYSGFWTESNYLEHKQELEQWIQQSGYQADGETVWARYNPPFTPWFLRRNEVLIPVIENSTQ
jgi:hypothetical protein